MLIVHYQHLCHERLMMMMMMMMMMSQVRVNRATKPAHAPWRGSSMAVAWQWLTWEDQETKALPAPPWHCLLVRLPVHHRRRYIIVTMLP